MDSQRTNRPLTVRSTNMKSFFQWQADVLVLNVLGCPGARQDAIGKVKGNQLKISVTALPRAGRATDHMVRFLATQFGVARSDIEVVFGRMNVNKQLRIKAPTTLPDCIQRVPVTPPGWRIEREAHLSVLFLIRARQSIFIVRK